MPKLQNTAKTNTTDMLSIQCLIFEQQKLSFTKYIYKKPSFVKLQQVLIHIGLQQRYRVIY